jgi:hypothetical protein
VLVPALFFFFGKRPHSTGVESQYCGTTAPPALSGGFETAVGRRHLAKEGSQRGLDAFSMWSASSSSALNENGDKGKQVCFLCHLFLWQNFKSNFN